MRLSEYVLQTFLENIFSLAIAIFSIFKMANGNFKMAARSIKFYKYYQTIYFECIIEWFLLHYQGTLVKPLLCDTAWGPIEAVLFLF